jgi:hypothetical protein
MDPEVCGRVNRAGQTREQFQVMKTSKFRPRHSARIVLVNWGTTGSSRRTFLCQFTSFGDTFFWLHNVWVSNDGEDWTGWNFANSSVTKVGKVRTLQSAVSTQYCMLTCTLQWLKTTRSITRNREFTLLTPSNDQAQWPLACWDSAFETRRVHRYVCCECWVLSGRGFCDGPIPRPEESYRVCV